MNCLVFVSFLCLEFITKCHGNYYWKDYRKEIPKDAFSAEPHSNKEQVYIGQSFLYDNPFQGIYPTTISKDKDTYIAMVGVRKADYFVQILCSSEPARFEWLPANTTHMHLLSTNNEIIRGGIEHVDRHGELAIGRIRIQGVPVIGKIMLEKDIGKSDMWFVHSDLEKKAESFEVLTYKPKKYMRGNETSFG